MSHTLSEVVKRHQERQRKQMAEEADTQARRQADIVARKEISGTETFGLIRDRASLMIRGATETTKNTQAKEPDIRVAQGRIAALEDLIAFFEGAAQEWAEELRTSG